MAKISVIPLVIVIVVLPTAHLVSILQISAQQGVVQGYIGDHVV